jgi:hypothetical protein
VCVVVPAQADRSTAVNGGPHRRPLPPVTPDARGRSRYPSGVAPAAAPPG